MVAVVPVQRDLLGIKPFWTKPHLASDTTRQWRRDLIEFDLQHLAIPGQRAWPDRERVREAPNFYARPFGHRPKVGLGAI